MGQGTGVVLADAAPLVRAGLRAVCEHIGMTVLGEAGDAAHLVSLAFSTRPELCVMDLGLPGDALAAVRDLRRGSVAVVVLTDRPEAGELLAAARAGAQGYVAKDRNVEHLPQALTAVLAGEVAVPRALVSDMLRELAKGSVAEQDPAVLDPRLNVLTRREREVLSLLRRGVPTSAIAARLFVAPVTVRTHVCAILRKLAVADRSALLDPVELLATAAIRPATPEQRAV